MPEKQNQRKSLNEILRKSQQKTQTTERMAELARGILPETRRGAAMGCGKYMTFLHSVDMETTKIETAYFCQNRLCPGCAWRKAARDAVQISCVLQQAVNAGYDLVFATLTARNVEGWELQDAIKNYDRAYTQMMRRGEFRSIRGAIRKLEVTYNSDTQTYHPHIHSVWMMPKGWRRAGNAAHITKTMLHRAWAESLQYKYAVSPKAQDIRRVNISRPEDVAEFAKYPAKSCDYLHSRQTFKTFHTALRGVRLITYMRDAATYRKMYKNGDLNQFATPDETEYYIRTYWTWMQNDYVLSKMDELDTPETFEILDTDEDVEEE